jgi:hypothetical protein
MGIHIPYEMVISWTTREWGLVVWRVSDHGLLLPSRPVYCMNQGGAMLATGICQRVVKPQLCFEFWVLTLVSRVDVYIFDAVNTAGTWECAK